MKIITKPILFLVLVVCCATGSLCQEENEFEQKSTREQRKEERKANRRSFDFSDPWMLGHSEFAPLAELRVHPGLLADSVRYRMYAIELGGAFILGDTGYSGNNGLFGGNTDWEYLAPFVSVEWHWANHDDTSDIRLEDYYSPFMLNTGLTGAIGDTYNFFLGVNGTVGVSTNFDDVFVRAGIGFDMMQMSFGIGTFINVSNRGGNPHELRSIYVNMKYILWNR